MATVKIVPGRSGCVWPRVLRTVRESRQAGRRLILYVPEQYTLQAERDLITGLGLPGLLDIQVISPRKLRQQVKERMGSGARKPLNEFGRAMAVHRVMSEKAKELTYFLLDGKTVDGEFDIPAIGKHFHFTARQIIYPGYCAVTYQEV